MNPVELKVELQENAHEFTLGMNEFLESGTKDYKELENLPSVNGTVLEGDKTTAEIIPIDGETLKINENGELSVIPGATGGDMTKAVYDTDDDGIVDMSAKVGGHTVEKDVPADAKFTDTTYDFISNSEMQGIIDAIFA